MTYSELVAKMWKPTTEEFVRGEIKCSYLKEYVAKYPSLFDMEDKQNDAPSFRQFLEIADEDALFEIYIITEKRDDARVTIEGIHTKVRLVVDKLTKIGRPDEKSKSKGVYRLWWD